MPCLYIHTDGVFILIFGHLLFPKTVNAREFFIIEDIVKEYSLHNASKYWYSYTEAFLNSLLTKPTIWKLGKHKQMSASMENLEQKSKMFAGMYKCNGGEASWETTTFNREQMYFISFSFH